LPGKRLVLGAYVMLLAAVVACVLSHWIITQIDARKAARHTQILATPVHEFRVAGLTLEQAIKHLSKQTGLPITAKLSPVRKDVLIEPKISQALYDVTLGQVLNVLLSPQPGSGQEEFLYGFDEAGTIVVTSNFESGCGSLAEYAVYDVRDFMPWGDKLQNHMATVCFLSPPAPVTPASIERDNLDVVVNFIMDTVDTTSWAATGGNLGTVTACDGRIFIWNVRSSHEKIERLLYDLRQPPPTP